MIFAWLIVRHTFKWFKTQDLIVSTFSKFKHAIQSLLASSFMFRTKKVGLLKRDLNKNTLLQVFFLNFTWEALVCSGFVGGPQ